jgi:hypothetical protein
MEQHISTSEHHEIMSAKALSQHQDQNYVWQNILREKGMRRLLSL